MFLQYYLNEDGERVYTLKVRRGEAGECVCGGGGAIGAGPPEEDPGPVAGVLSSVSLFLEQKFDPLGQQTCSAHPARFSPDDKYSRHRITIKKRFKVLMTQQPRPVL